MIGHFLGTLTVEQEDRVLTQRLIPGGISAGCLLAQVQGTRCLAEYVSRRKTIDYWPFQLNPMRDVGVQFDRLCHRFGAPRVNAAIRQRILDNRARCVLQSAPEVEWVGSPRTEPQ